MLEESWKDNWNLSISHPTILPSRGTRWNAAFVRSRRKFDLIDSVDSSRRITDDRAIQNLERKTICPNDFTKIYPAPTELRVPRSISSKVNGVAYGFRDGFRVETADTCSWPTGWSDITCNHSVAFTRLSGKNRRGSTFLIADVKMSKSRVFLWNSNDKNRRRGKEKRKKRKKRRWRLKKNTRVWKK